MKGSEIEGRDRENKKHIKKIDLIDRKLFMLNIFSTLSVNMATLTTFALPSLDLLIAYYFLFRKNNEKNLR